MRVRLVVAMGLVGILAGLFPGPADAVGSAETEARIREIRRKLDALEVAREAGILSEEEYARKKAALDGQLRKLRAAFDEALSRQSAKPKP